MCKQVYNFNCARRRLLHSHKQFDYEFSIVQVFDDQLSLATTISFVIYKTNRCALDYFTLIFFLLLKCKGLL